MRLNDFRNESVELDFNKTVKLAEIENKWVTVTNTTTITTKYGKKNVAVLDDNSMIYLTMGFEDLMNETLPIKIEIIKAISKSGNEYWTYRKEREEFKKLKDIYIEDIEEELTLITARSIKTKYGDAVIVMFEEYDDTFICNCNFLMTDKIQNALASGTKINCIVVKKISKTTGKEYFTLA